MKHHRLKVCNQAFPLSTCSANSSAPARPTQMPLTYYYHPLAFNPAKPSLVIAEKRIPCKQVGIDLFSGQSLDPWFMKINPKSWVPVLDTGDKVMNESAEICRYLDTYDGKPLGGDKVDRAEVEKFVKDIDAWDGNFYAAVHLPKGAQAIMEGLSKYRIKYAEARLQTCEESLKAAYEAKIKVMKSMAAEKSQADYPEKVKANQAQLAALLDGLEARLTKGATFAAGSDYSVVDALFSPILYRIHMLGQYKAEIEPRAQVKAYLQRLRERPSWNQVFGTADSGFGKLSWMLPAILKSKWAAITGRY